MKTSYVSRLIKARGSKGESAVLCISPCHRTADIHAKVVPKAKCTETCPYWLPASQAYQHAAKVTRFFTFAAGVLGEAARIDVNYFLTCAGRASIACLDRPTAGDAAFLRLG
jgi:hypothetical protein